MNTLRFTDQRRPVAAFVLVALIGVTSSTPLRAQGPEASATASVRAATPALAIDLKARTLRPGELLVVTMAVPPPATDVRVRVFDRTVAAFPIDDGRWRALVGIDLDQRFGTYTVEAQVIDGQSILQATRAFVVQRRAFPVRTLSVAPDFVNPPPAVTARIEAEQQFTRAVYAESATTRLWTGPFVRPVPQAANSRFGTRSVFNGERRNPHAGTDFLSPAGTPIRSPNNGRIVAARDLFFTGNTVIIDHGLGVFSLMAHMSRLDVTEGEDVVAGQQLGLVGATGRVTGPHLHWAMAVAGARVDPISVLALLGPPSTPSGSGPRR